MASLILLLVVGQTPDSGHTDRSGQKRKDEQERSKHVGRVVSLCFYTDDMLSLAATEWPNDINQGDPFKQRTGGLTGGWAGLGGVGAGRELQLLTSRYCNGPQTEHTEWRRPRCNRNDAMRCNAPSE